MTEKLKTEPILDRLADDNEDLEMFRRTAARRSLAIVLISLLVILPPTFIARSAGGGHTRSFPSDIAAENITSHTDGAYIDLAPQFINATFRNVGTEVYGDEVISNLTIWSPASGCPVIIFFIVV